MLRTLPQTRDYSQLQRAVAILIFTGLTAMSAQFEIRLGGLVPFTLQVLVVLLSGMVLGARDGMISQVLYVGLLRLNLPIGAGAAGAAALLGPTAGYLLGFIPAAGVVGFLVEKSGPHFWLRWLAGVAGIVVIYVLGVIGLLPFVGSDLNAAWVNGVAPFIVVDLAKAIIAASLAEGGRAALMRNWLN